MDNETIYIALAIYDPSGNYSRHAGALIASVMDNTKSSVCFCILHDESLSVANMDKLAKTAEKRGGLVKFIDVSKELEKLANVVNVKKLTGVFSPGALFRLFTADVIEYEKIIYLDCDIIVTMDIKELWEIDIADYCIAAVGDLAVQGTWKKVCTSSLSVRMKIMKISPNKYFNSGVSLLNLKQIRNDFDFLKEGLNFFARYSLCTVFPDQDFLNRLFQDSCLLIDPKFNTFSGSADHNSSTDINGKIWHFSYDKPWIFHKPDNPSGLLYWKYLAASAWGDEVTSYMMKANGGQYFHRHSSDCMKKLGEVFRENFTKSSLLRITKAYYGEIRYQLTKGK